MTINIRRIRSDEWQKSRSLRLRALADAPTAFGSTLAEEQAFPDEVWRERTLGAAAGTECATFIAEDDLEWVGTVTGLATQNNSTLRGTLLVAMFVSGGVRNRGVDVALLQALFVWARDCNADHVKLWVTSTNKPAVALYEKCGFRCTGEEKQLPHTPSLTEQEMIRTLR